MVISFPQCKDIDPCSGLKSARLLALLDPLLGGAPLIVEGDDLLRRPVQVGHDEADPWEKFPAMPLNFSDDPTRTVPALGLIHEINLE